MRVGWSSVRGPGYSLAISLQPKISVISLPARSKAWVYGRSPAAIVGSNSAEGMDASLL